jgi:hypothetical protein
MSELAARLGSCNLYTRSGSVIWIEDGRHGLGCWLRGGSGLGQDSALVVEHATIGGYSIELTAGSTLEHYYQISRPVPYPHEDNWGVETAVALGTIYVRFALIMRLFTGDTLYTATFGLDYENTRLYYKDQDDNRVAIDSMPETVNAYGLYQMMKMTVDAVDKDYVTVQFNDTVYSLAGIPLKGEANAEPKRLQPLLTLRGRAANNDKAIVNYMIVTTGEP